MKAKFLSQALQCVNFLRTVFCSPSQNQGLLECHRPPWVSASRGHHVERKRIQEPLLDQGENGLRHLLPAVPVITQRRHLSVDLQHNGVFLYWSFFQVMQCPQKYIPYDLVFSARNFVLILGL